MSDLEPGTRFRPILESEHTSRSIKTVILCSGKHYYSLLEYITQTAAAADRLSDFCFVRIEELSPFPRAELANILRRYKRADLVWAQEEPENQGPWTYVRPRLEQITRGLGKYRKIRYAGRKSGATVATGVGAWHKAESLEILRDAFRF